MQIYKYWSKFILILIYTTDLEQLLGFLLHMHLLPCITALLLKMDDNKSPFMKSYKVSRFLENHTKTIVGVVK